jgi:hypothetical protein
MAPRNVSTALSDRRPERTLGELLGELTHDLGSLVHKEVELAKIELHHEVVHAASAAGGIAVGSALMHLGLLALGATVVLLLIRLGIAPWLAGLICGVVLLAAGAGIVRSAMNRLKRVDPVPRRAVAEAKQTVQLVKEQL